MAELKVELGPSSYNIHIGKDPSQLLGSLLSEMGCSRNVLIITDENVGRLYGNKLLDTLNSAGFFGHTYTIKPGEDSKSASVAMPIYTKAIELQLDRKSPIIALGGGVVGDLTGFIAATYLRGVPFIQIPTSLLAQVDSSVGGKVAINHPLGKNLIGAFYQPKIVLIDPSMLSTLPERELYTGLAEVIKYGLISDCNFFEFLNEHYSQILAGNEEILEKIIYRSCQIKADIVAKDERESGLRIILNFGHTIAHAIEAYTGYKKYTHGEAVAIGMHGAALLSYYLGYCNEQTLQAVRSCVERFRLPLKAELCPADALLSLLARDKKTIGGKINWVLINDVGHVSICNDVPETIIYKALQGVT